MPGEICLSEDTFESAVDCLTSRIKQATCCKRELTEAFAEKMGSGLDLLPLISSTLR